MVNKNDLEKLIIEKKKSNLKNHFLTSFNHDSSTYSGEISENEILIWKSTVYMRSNFPIFHIKFDKNNLLSEITVSKNLFHKLINFAFLLLLIFLLVNPFIDTELEFKSSLTISLVNSTLLILGYILFSFVSRFERKNQTTELKQYIDEIEKSRNHH